MRRIDLILYGSFFAAVIFACAYFGSIAYANSGQILSNAKATEYYLATPTVEAGDLAELATYQIGDELEIEGGGFGALVPLFGSPGGRFFTSQVLQGTPVTVLELGIDAEGVIWYRVEGLMGTGWLTEANLRPRTETSVAE
jgi:hypothetical protein